MTGQLNKGILELVILRQISHNDMYGYELVKKLREYYVDVDISVYYSILRRLHKKELLQCYEIEESKGPKRKYYHLTDRGKEYFQQKMTESMLLNHQVKLLMQG